MAPGSYLRFAVGILLSLSLVMSFFGDGKISIFSVLLAFIFLLLAVVWAVFRF